MCSRHCAAECRLKASGDVFDRRSLCIRSMSDMVNCYRNAMPAPTSALPPIATEERTWCKVREVPKDEIARAIGCSVLGLSPPRSGFNQHYSGDRDGSVA
jgi:hypothetical protein